MQQQLLTLLSGQVKDMQAARTLLVDNQDATEQLGAFFALEAGKLSKEVTQLSETMYARISLETDERVAARRRQALPTHPS